MSRADSACDPTIPQSAPGASVVHVVPDSLENLAKRFVGSTKDTMGRVEYFAARGIETTRIVAEKRSDAFVLAALRSLDLANVDTVFFEFEVYTKSFKYLRGSHPRIRTLARPINANFLHWLHILHGRSRLDRALGASWPSRLTQMARITGEALTRLRVDAACARNVDCVLPICDWETRHYWGRLSGHGRSVTVPYFLPRAFEQELPAPGPKENICVCLMGTGGQMTPILFDLGQRFLTTVKELGSAFPDWRFMISGRIKPPGLFGDPGRVEPTDLMDSPLPLLGRARAIALVSGLGYGFKTKILDAISCGCYVIVTSDIVPRLPAAVLPFCIELRDRSPAAFADALELSMRPFPYCEANRSLRNEAYSALDRALGIESGAAEAQRLETTQTEG